MPSSPSHKTPKTITVVITGREPEALRMSVGLTLCDDDIRVMFIDDGVHALTDGSADRHIQTLIQLKKGLFVHDESMTSRRIESPHYPVQRTSSEEIVRMIEESDAVIAW